MKQKHFLELCLPFSCFILYFAFPYFCTAKEFQATSNSGPLCNLEIAIKTSDTSICLGNIGKLTAEVQGQVTGQLKYEWSNGGAEQISIINPAVSSTYKVTVTDANNCSGSASKNIVVKPSFTAGILPYQAKICQGSHQPLEANVTGGQPPYRYTWSGLSYNNDKTIYIPDTVSGAITYNVIVTDAQGCTATDRANIIIQPGPVAFINPVKSEVCTGQTSPLLATITEGKKPYSYKWSHDLGTASFVDVTPASEITYSVTATDANQCSASASRTVYIHPLPVVTIAPAKINACSERSTQLAASVKNISGPYTYKWDNGTDSTPNINVAPGLTTTYVVTVTDIYKCSASAGSTINVFNPLVPSITRVSDTICAGSSAPLIAAAHGGNPPYQYKWSNGVSSYNSTYRPQSNSIYAVTVTDASHCTAVKTGRFTVLPKTFTTAQIHASANSICLGNYVTLTITGIKPGAKWNWYTGESCCTKKAGTGTVITVAPQTTENYYVKSTGGCGDGEAKSLRIVVKDTATPPVSIAVSPSDTVRRNTAVTLELKGGSPGLHNPGSHWAWYSGSCCNGTRIDSAKRTIIVRSAKSTAYYVRAEGGCNISIPATVTILVNDNERKLSHTTSKTVAETFQTSKNNSNRYSLYNTGNIKSTDTVSKAVAVKTIIKGSPTARYDTARSLPPVHDKTGKNKQVQPASAAVADTQKTGSAIYHALTTNHEIVTAQGTVEAPNSENKNTISYATADVVSSTRDTISDFTYNQKAAEKALIAMDYDSRRNAAETIYNLLNQYSSAAALKFYDKTTITQEALDKYEGLFEPNAYVIDEIKPATFEKTDTNPAIKTIQEYVKDMKMYFPGGLQTHLVKADINYSLLGKDTLTVTLEKYVTGILSNQTGSVGSHLYRSHVVSLLYVHFANDFATAKIVGAKLIRGEISCADCVTQPAKKGKTHPTKSKAKSRRTK